MHISIRLLCDWKWPDARWGAGFIVHQEYGALLADPETWPAEGRVGRTLTSVAGVACLRAERGVGQQLTSHVYGLLKARDFDKEGGDAGTNTVDHRGTGGDHWLSSVEGATWVVETTDRLCDVFKGAAANPASKL